MTITSCHAIRAAMLDDAVYLTKTGIGCIAGAISLGLMEKESVAVRCLQVGFIPPLAVE